MCGFVGYFQPKGKVPQAALGLMAHRGPDASGDWSSPDGGLWLGHVRLSILELTDAGSQPMVSASGRTVLVFNGEIYNHQEVRRSLRPVAWRGHADTETLVEAWEQEGPKCLDRMRGMFAFAVYDTKNPCLDLVRDRLGIKPLYIRESADGVSFASEVRALNGGRRIRLSDEALGTYLMTGHLPGSGEIGEGFSMLQAGSHMHVDANGRAHEERWWPPRERGEENKGSPAEIRAELRALLESSVREHLLADVPVGCFLSGGTDSSVLTLLAAKAAGRQLETFTVGFPVDGLDERPIAKLVAEKTGAQHREVEVTESDCIGWIVDGVGAMDVPSADAINSFIVSRAVSREGIKVALTGLGGDELFGGYPSFQDVPKMAALGILPHGVASGLVRLLPAPLRTKLDGARAYDAFNLALLRRRWWSPSDLKAAGLRAGAVWPALPAKSRDAFAEVTWAEIVGYAEPMLLRDSDQMSMASSLELRVPFFDHRLVEFALALPERMKRGAPPKRLLIEAFADELPQEVWARPRQGFVLPMDEWMRGPLRDFAVEGLEKVKALLAPQWVDAVRTGFEERRLHWTRLWQLVVLGHYGSRSE
jgi:asparagine synthase (glutamine-hydrolysing)